MSNIGLILKIKLPSCVHKLKIDATNPIGNRVGYSNLMKVVEEEFGHAAKKVNITVFDGEDNVCIKSFDKFVFALEENVDSGRSAITMNVKPSTNSRSDRVRDEPQERNVTEILSETSWEETSGAPASDDSANMQEGKRGLPEDPLNDDFIDFYEDVDLSEKVPAKMARKEVQGNQLKDLCHKSDKEHLSTYGVGCSFSVVEEDILCPICSATLKIDGLGISKIHQKITVHCERVCHRTNIYSSTSNMIVFQRNSLILN